MTSLASLILAAGLLAGLLGVALVAWGLVGRRVGSEPRCRRCGFDLSGLDVPAACPECGTSLTATRAIRAGARRRGWVRVAIGSPLVLLGGLVLGAGVWARASNINLNRYKPLPWLIADAKAGGPSAQPALDELIWRATSGSISKADYAPIVGAGLALQGDLKTTWEPKWGTLLLGAFTTGAMTPQEKTTFLRQAFNGRSRVRTRVRQGDRIRFELAGEYRLGPLPAGTSPLSLGLQVAPIAAASEDDRADMAGSSVETFATLSPHMTFAAADRAGIGLCMVVAPAHDNEWSLGLTPGEHKVSAAIAITVSLAPPNAGNLPLLTPKLPPEWTTMSTVQIGPVDLALPRVTWVEREVFTLEVLPPDDPGVTMTDSPALASTLHDAIKIRGARVEHSKQGPVQLGLSIQHDGPLPVGVGAEVFLRDATGKEWYAGSAAMAADPNASNTSFTVGVNNYNAGTPGGQKPRDYSGPIQPIETFDADTVTVILRPSPAAARLTTDIEEIFDGELVFENVPVEVR